MSSTARWLTIVPATVAVLSLAACGERHVEASAPPSEAAKVVGTPPAPPQPDPPTVQPVAPGTTEIAKPVEIAAMPLPGQADDPETLAVLNSERSEAIDVLKDPELAKIANDDKALEVWQKKKLREAQAAQYGREAQAKRLAQGAKAP
jgi:hypothetical protein